MMIMRDLVHNIDMPLSYLKAEHTCNVLLCISIYIYIYIKFYIYIYVMIFVLRILCLTVSSFRLDPSSLRQVMVRYLYVVCFYQLGP